MGNVARGEADGYDLVLRTPRKQYVYGVVLFSVSGVVGAISGAGGDWAGWLILGGSVLLVAGAAAGLLSPPQLMVRGATMTLTYPRGRYDIDLRHCGEFRVWKVPTFGAARVWRRQRTVVFDFDGPSPRQSRILAPMSRAISGARAGTNGTYGMKADDLASLLNRYRQAALASADESPST